MLPAKHFSVFFIGTGVANAEPIGLVTNEDQFGTWLSLRLIEKQLAHAEKNEIWAVYNRAEYWPERIKTIQEWADYVDGLRVNKVRDIAA